MPFSHPLWGTAPHTPLVLLLAQPQSGSGSATIALGSVRNRAVAEDALIGWCFSAAWGMQVGSRLGLLALKLAGVWAGQELGSRFTLVRTQETHLISLKMERPRWPCRSQGYSCPRSALKTPHLPFSQFSSQSRHNAPP